MPKHVIEFNLPEEQEEFNIHVRASDYMLAIDDFNQFLRNKLKYEELNSKEQQIYQEIRDKWNEILIYREVN